MFDQHNTLSYLVAFVAALVASMASIPQIIYVAKRKRLFDVPDNHRKLHKRIVPNLGGVGIFLAYILTASILIRPIAFPCWNYIVAASLMLFIIGIKDDLVSVSPAKKFMTQCLAAFIIAYFADIRVMSLHGFLGLSVLPYWFSIGFTVIGCMFVTNAFNLIDGIDGLAGATGLLGAVFFGVFLALSGHVSGAVIAFSLAGALVGFLRYNVAPARIFMGDTGSLLLGFTLCVLGILFLNVQPSLASYLPGWQPTSALVIALAVLFIPIFDTFRVFATRILKGHSPFRADRTHLHHYLLDLGLTHTQAVSLLCGANVLIIVVCGVVHQYNVHIAVFALFFTAFAMHAVVFFMRRARSTAIANAAHTASSAFAAAHHAAGADMKSNAFPPVSSTGASFGDKKADHAVKTLSVNGHRIAVELPAEQQEA